MIREILAPLGMFAVAAVVWAMPTPDFNRLDAKPPSLPTVGSYFTPTPKEKYFVVPIEQTPQSTKYRVTYPSDYPMGFGTDVYVTCDKENKVLSTWQK